MSKAEFGRRVGRARSTITEACEDALAAACLHGGRLDVSHSAVAAWCTARGIDPRVLHDIVVSKPAASRAAPSPEPKRSKPDSNARSIPLDGLLDLTLRQITDRFGSQQGFADFLDQRKKLADTLARELQVDRDRGLLVPRAFVEMHVFGLIDGAWRRLLQDMPRPLAAEIYSLSKSGAPIEDAIRVTQRSVSSQLQHVKDRAAKSVRAAAKGQTNSARPHEERHPDRDDTNR